MIFLSRRVLAIVNMLIFVVIFTILSGVLLSLVSSQTRLMESNIRRIKGRYAAESGSVVALEALRKSDTLSNPSVEWYFNPATGNPDITKLVTVSNATGGIDGTSIVNASVDYTMNWD